MVYAGAALSGAALDATVSAAVLDAADTTVSATALDAAVTMLCLCEEWTWLFKARQVGR